MIDFLLMNDDINGFVKDRVIDTTNFPVIFVASFVNQFHMF